MVRSFPFRSGLAALVLLVFAGVFVATAQDQMSGGQDQDASPLAVDRYTTIEKTEVEVNKCIQLRLQLSDLRLGEPFAGSIRIENECEVAVAVLTGPIEVRQSGKQKGGFPWEGDRDNVYARLYFFDPELDLAKAFRGGDTYIEVRGSPEYVAVKSRSVLTVPFVGGADLLR